MSIKFGIDLGHNVRFDGGAAGVDKSENQLIMEVGNKVICKLQSLGHQVVECKPESATSSGHALRQRTYTANVAGVDRFVSIHFNAFNGQAHGAEVLYISQAGRKLAQPVQDEIVKLGFTNRGVKYRNNLHVLRATNAPAILIECCFCDNWKDMKRYDAEKMANAIVKGLTGSFPNSSNKPCPTCGRV
ncbi:peptidoglycan-binding domain 1 [Calothrix parasitica NIES-267]|uniref:Peptidoglycan-binding domain 1 n=1 Tax=Calothrix parasitica NIES-267 TaxID=1973488 RepID=A0A1Z4LXP0_9CYAN|nr:peptidoglycan-binding domain 1 [Calothrix parasitica NIES-267]